MLKSKTQTSLKDMECKARFKMKPQEGAIVSRLVVVL